MEGKKIKIESDGTKEGTKVYLDNKELQGIKRIEFALEPEIKFPRVLLMEQVVTNGIPMTRPSKMIDDKTNKTVSVEKAVLTPIQIEFEKVIGG